MHQNEYHFIRVNLLPVSTLLGHLQGEYSVTLLDGHTVKWECAFAFILRWDVSCTARGLRENVPLLSSSVDRCLVLSAVSVRRCLCFHPPLTGVLYCPRSPWECAFAFVLRWQVSCTARGLRKGTFSRSAVHTLTADSTRHLTTEDESKGTFPLNCISASNSVTEYSPWWCPSRVETCRRFLRIKIVCILVHQLVNIISYDTVPGHGTH
jgi:hypothetical protein